MAKMRSPNYPAIGLSTAVNQIRAMWKKEQRTAVPFEVAAKAIGYQSVSGPARTALAAIKKYGLLDEDDDGMVKLSDVAIKILHSGPDEKLEALRYAALKPPLFRELYETRPSASDDALKSHLMTKLYFSETGARQCIQAFRGTLAVAKLAPGADNVSQGTEDGESVRSEIEVNTDKPANQRVQELFRWPLPDGVLAELRLVGGQLTEKNVDALTDYLETVKKVLKRSEKPS